MDKNSVWAVPIHVFFRNMVISMAACVVGAFAFRVFDPEWNVSVGQMIVGGIIVTVVSFVLGIYSSRDMHENHPNDNDPVE